MQKEFKTLEQQIEILKNRGMTIKDEDKTKKYLLSNNYYNIINGYSKPFLKEKNEYLSGTSFNEVSKLYFFDGEIKQTLLNAILCAEHHLKSSFAYHFGEAHRHKPESYLDVSAYNHKFSSDIAYIITKLNRIIRLNQHYPNNAIYHYKEKYGFVPIWVLVNFLDFGDLYTLIKISPISIQNKIARDMTEFIHKNHINTTEYYAPATMLSMIKNIHETRNICAHNKRLIYFKCRADSTFWAPLHTKFNITNNDSRNSVYTTFLSLQCFISDTEFAQLNNTFRKRIRNVLGKHLKTIEVNKILRSLGFPDNWQNLPKIPQ